jgi:hypothetical protein
MSDLLKDATATLNELLRMHELTQELLETLTVTMMWVKDYTMKHNIPLPRETSYQSLINKAQMLIEEIASSDDFSQRRNPTTTSQNPELGSGSLSGDWSPCYKSGDELSAL